MADLITHLCSVLLPASVCPLRWTGPMAVGVVLPDVLGRVPAMMVSSLVPTPGPALERALLSLDVFHMPAGILLGAALVGFFTASKDRVPMVVGLALGGMLHLLLDVAQFHHGSGYPLFFPFSLARYEVGMVGSETTVGWSGGLAVLTALAWWVRWKVRTWIVQRKKDG